MGILICGLNGAGKSTIGELLAEKLDYQFIDNEDLYFPKTNKNYMYANPRSKEEVIRLLEGKITSNRNFVFAAVKGDYGNLLISQLDYIVVVEVPKQIRLKRVKKRAFQKFGKRMIADGDLAQKEKEWYDYIKSRPEDYVEKWIRTIECPVLRIDGTKTVEEIMDTILDYFTTAKKVWNYE